MTVKGHIGVFARCGDVRNEVLAILAPTALAFGRAGSRLSRSNIGCLFPILRRDLEGKVARCACTPRRSSAPLSNQRWIMFFGLHVRFTPVWSGRTPRLTNTSDLHSSAWVRRLEIDRRVLPFRTYRAKDGLRGPQV